MWYGGATTHYIGSGSDVQVWAAYKNIADFTIANGPEGVRNSEYAGSFWNLVEGSHSDQIYAQVNGQITLFSNRGEILAQTSLHPDPGSHNDPQTHYISQQSFAAIQPDAQATSHFVSLEQLLSAAINKTLQNAYRHADFNIRSNIGNLYFLETGIIEHKDKILGALAIFIEVSARQKIYSDLRVQSVAAVGLGILASVLISLLIFYRVSHPITVLTRRLQQKNAQTSLPSPELMLEQAPKAPEGSEVANLTAVLREMSRKYYHQIDMQNRFTSDVIHEVKNPLTSGALGACLHPSL